MKSSLANIELERLVLRHAFSGRDISQVVVDAIYSEMSEEYLFFPQSLALWEFARKYRDEMGVAPSWSEALADVSLQDHKSWLNGANSPCYRNAAFVDKDIAKLKELATRRAIQANAASASEAAYDLTLPLEDVLAHVSDLAAASAGQNAIAEASRFVFGSETEEQGVEDLLRWVIDESRNPCVIATGLQDFDNECGGFPDTGVVLLGATSSSGKSVMANQIGYNMAKIYKGMRVKKTSLEMSREQEFLRIASSLSGVNLQQLILNDMSRDERLAVESAINETRAFIRSNNNRLEFWSPNEPGGTSIDSVLRNLRATRSRVGIIDYAGLLNDETAAETQAISLSRIVRKCKVFATLTRTLIILLVQVDDKTHAVRYSRGMLEHADVAMLWYPTLEEKAQGIWYVYVVKNRNGPIGKFPCTWELARMRVSSSGPFLVGDTTSEQAEVPVTKSDAAVRDRAVRQRTAGEFSGA